MDSPWRTVNEFGYNKDIKIGSALYYTIHEVFLEKQIPFTEKPANSGYVKIISVAVLVQNPHLAADIKEDLAIMKEGLKGIELGSLINMKGIFQTKSAIYIVCPPFSGLLGESITKQLFPEVITLEYYSLIGSMLDAKMVLSKVLGGRTFYGIHKGNVFIDNGRFKVGDIMLNTRLRNITETDSSQLAAIPPEILNDYPRDPSNSEQVTDSIMNWSIG